MEARMKFLADLPLWDEERPYELFFKAPPYIPTSNLSFELQSGIKVNDIRIELPSPHLDREGFTFIRHQFQLRPRAADFEAPENDSTIVIPFLNETRAFLQHHLEAEKVVCFDWRLRKQQQMPEDYKSLDDLKDIRSKALLPASIVHVDYSWSGGEFNVKRYLSKEELEEFYCSSWKVRIINVWRPLVTVVENFPIAFCDPTSVRGTELIEKDNVHRDHVVGSLYLINRPYHRWYYLPDQKIDEIAVFVSWDADERTGTPVCPPHSAFELPRAPSACKPRESLEARFIVVTKRKD